MYEKLVGRGSAVLFERRSLGGVGYRGGGMIGNWEPPLGGRWWQQTRFVVAIVSEIQNE